MRSEDNDTKWDRFSSQRANPRDLISFALDRMVNPTGVGEGSNLPPKMAIGIRVQAPTRFRVLKQTEETGQTRIVLSWENNAAMQRYNPQYRVKMSDRTKGVEFQSLLVAGDPPCEVIIRGTSSQQGNYILMLETILSNGLTSLEDSNPTCSVRCFPL
jgi:hypothetical protein